MDSPLIPGPARTGAAADAPTSTPFSSAVRAVAIQDDGKILLGGDFHQVVGEARPALARLNSNGSIDRTFTPPTRSGDTVQG